MDTIILERVDQAYAFEATDALGHQLRMDASPALGGSNAGIRPMQTLLMGLGGCGGVDIVSILKKQKQDLQKMKVVIKGQREEGKEPSLWKTIELAFHFTGQIDPDKAEKAIALSLNKYCSVAATLRAAGASITWTIHIASPAPQPA
jgi:putative redox protein